MYATVQQLRRVLEQLTTVPGYGTELFTTKFSVCMFKKNSGNVDDNMLFKIKS